MALFLGCPIWAYKDWVGSFYPQGMKATDYLREYAARLNAVEGNTTFYAVPALSTIQSWVSDTPQGFRFCPKLPRGISHTGELVPHRQQAGDFIDIMSRLGVRLGPMFLQLPPRYPPSQVDDLRVFLHSWPSEVQLAVEVRHADWFDLDTNQALNELLSGFSMARVVIDTRPIRSLSEDKILAGSVYQRLLQARQRKPDVPVLPEQTTPFVFLRYIGHPQLDANQPFIKEWGQYLAGRLKAGAQAYVFCHCPDERLDPWLCRAFHQEISGRVALPPLPWDEADAGVPRQTSFF
jgi:uncharacterized protein YecE (DUF72 family)